MTRYEYGFVKRAQELGYDERSVNEFRRKRMLKKALTNLLLAGGLGTAGYFAGNALGDSMVKHKVSWRDNGKTYRLRSDAGEILGITGALAGGLAGLTN